MWTTALGAIVILAEPYVRLWVYCDCAIWVFMHLTFLDMVVVDCANSQYRRILFYSWQYKGRNSGGSVVRRIAFLLLDVWVSYTASCVVCFDKEELFWISLLSARLPCLKVHFCFWKQLHGVYSISGVLSVDAQASSACCLYCCVVTGRVGC